MRSTGWLPISILLVVAACLGFSWALHDSELQYLFDGPRGMLRPEVADWWRLWLPVGAALGLIAILTSIATLRALKSQAWSEIPGITALGLLGLAAMPGTLHWFQARSEPDVVTCEKRVPEGASEVFHHTQWRALARMVPWNDRPPLFRKDSAGIQGHRGLIPYDPFLLDRLSFVGLTRAEVEELLGPGRPPEKEWHPAGLRYYMRGRERNLEGASLFLRTGDSTDPDTVVKSEYLRILYRPGCPVLPRQVNRPYR